MTNTFRRLLPLPIAIAMCGILSLLGFAWKYLPVQLAQAPQGVLVEPEPTELPFGSAPIAETNDAQGEGEMLAVSPYRTSVEFESTQTEVFQEPASVRASQASVVTAAFESSGHTDVPVAADRSRQSGQQPGHQTSHQSSRQLGLQGVEDARYAPRTGRRVEPQTERGEAAGGALLLPRTQAAPSEVVLAQFEEPQPAPAASPKAKKLPPQSPNPTEPTSGDVPTDFKQIDQLIEAGSLIDAHRKLSAIYWAKPEMRAAVLPRIERTAQQIFFSPQPHFVDPYVVQSGDRLQTIATKYQLAWPYLASLNKIDPKRLRVGQKLKVTKGPFSVFVDLSDFELTVHAHGFFVKRYLVGVGKDGASPQGKFTVLEKIEKAQYTDPNGKVIAGGHPTNPLGSHWIDIGNSFGIHGTIEPETIGKAASRGCIRMRNEEVAEVYNFLIKGSEVVIRE